MTRAVTPETRTRWRTRKGVKPRSGAADTCRADARQTEEPEGEAGLRQPSFPFPWILPFTLSSEAAFPCQRDTGGHGVAPGHDHDHSLLLWHVITSRPERGSRRGYLRGECHFRAWLVRRIPKPWHAQHHVCFSAGRIRRSRRQGPAERRDLQRLRRSRSQPGLYQAAKGHRGSAAPMHSARESHVTKWRQAASFWRRRANLEPRTG